MFPFSLAAIFALAAVIFYAQGATGIGIVYTVGVIVFLYFAWKERHP